jgi:hypothetical protein
MLTKAPASITDVGPFSTNFYCNNPLNTTFAGGFAGGGVFDSQSFGSFVNTAANTGVGQGAAPRGAVADTA